MHIFRGEAASTGILIEDRENLGPVIFRALKSRS